MTNLLVQLHGVFSTTSQVLLGLLTVPLIMTIARMLKGPTHADRFVALDMLTGLAVAAGALMLGATGRREYLDVALGLAVFGFMGACALAGFLERKGRQKR